jgi:hypothetical protein
MEKGNNFKKMMRGGANNVYSLPENLFVTLNS